MIPTTYDKAQELNLDPLVYGTFAEIGAGRRNGQLFLPRVRHRRARGEDDFRLRHDHERRHLRPGRPLCLGDPAGFDARREDRPGGRPQGRLGLRRRDLDTGLRRPARSLPRAREADADHGPLVRRPPRARPHLLGAEGEGFKVAMNAMNSAASRSRPARSGWRRRASTISNATGR